MSKKETLADLRRSGLSDKDFVQLKLKTLSGPQTKSITEHVEKESYKIPYFSPEGKPTGFFRLRFLGESTGFGKMRRYWQPKNTLPQVYFSPQFSWPAVLSDVSRDLLITEGEKKAAKACREGLACIGLGGVWAWRSKKARLDVLPELRAISWTGRGVGVVFDSDIVDKPEVMFAMEALCVQLLKMGAKPYIVSLPAEDGEKVGLDDFLVAHSVTKFLKLPREDFSRSTEFWKLNEELAVITSLDSIYHFQTRSLKSTRALVETTYADRRMKIGPIESQKEVNAVAEWVKWPLRRTYKGFTYAPGEASVVDGHLNTWTGWGCVPKKGNVKPWHAFMEYIFRGEPASRVWFEQWLAYPLQYPGTKLFTAVLLWSRHEGVGKSFVGEIMQRIYGANYSVVSQEELHSTFNEWARYKQFVMGEEITGSDRRKDADNLKYILTRSTITVNVKYQPHYALQDCINYLFNSNNPNAQYLSDTDRRNFIHEIKDKPMPADFYKELDAWKAGDGPAALFHYLLNIDVSKFNPKAPALITASKLQMTELTQSDTVLWAKLLFEDPDTVLRISGKPIVGDLWSIDQLKALLPAGAAISNAALAVALRRVGFRHSEPTKVNGLTFRLWAVRNKEKWETASHQDRVLHYTNTFMVGAGPVSADNKVVRITKRMKK